jgi:hypothetical protein
MQLSEVMLLLLLLLLPPPSPPPPPPQLQLLVLLNEIEWTKNDFYCTTALDNFQDWCCHRVKK